MSNYDLCLVSCLHDPLGAMTRPAYKYFLDIRTLYTDVIIKATTETDDRLLAHLQPYLHVQPANGAGRAMREALARALSDSDCSYFHYIDFDRILFWYMNFPSELDQVLCSRKTDKMVVLGRTHSAMHSHPLLQRKTEEIQNILAATLLGRQMDILAASRIIPRKVAIEIVKRSEADNPACICLEWPLIAGEVEYLEVNGLGYESALLGIEKPEIEEVRMRIDNLACVMEMVYGG